MFWCYVFGFIICFPCTPFFVEVDKQLGSWTNDGVCVAKGDNPTCGPGNQNQVRTCIDGTNNKCTAADTIQTISCVEAGTALPECSQEGA